MPGISRERRACRQAGPCGTTPQGDPQVFWERRIETLPGIHGEPVRLVTPGLFGTMQIKWLTRLRFETAEAPNFYHATEYRMPYERMAPFGDDCAVSITQYAADSFC